jgi:hypothetical protein
MAAGCADKMGSLESFLATQDRIYEKFRNSESVVEAEGIDSALKPGEVRGGYLVAFQHPEPVICVVEGFSERIANAVPAISYKADAIHTTIATACVSSKFSPDSDVLERLCLCVREADIRKNPYVAYNGWFYDKTCVIAAVIPDVLFVEAVERVVSRCMSAGIDAKQTGGAHITASRFKEQRTPGYLQDFNRVMRSGPAVGDSRPESVATGYFTWTGDNFVFTIEDSFVIGE